MPCSPQNKRTGIGIWNDAGAVNTAVALRLFPYKQENIPSGISYRGHFAREFRSLSSGKFNMSLLWGYVFMNYEIHRCSAL